MEIIILIYLIYMELCYNIDLFDIYYHLKCKSNVKNAHYHIINFRSIQYHNFSKMIEYS